MTSSNHRSGSSGTSIRFAWRGGRRTFWRCKAPRTAPPLELGVFNKHSVEGQSSLLRQPGFAGVVVAVVVVVGTLCDFGMVKQLHAMPSHPQNVQWFLWTYPPCTGTSPSASPNPFSGADENMIDVSFGTLGSEVGTTPKPAKLFKSLKKVFENMVLGVYENPCGTIHENHRMARLE